mmetsp:Transcript_14125/g.30640  ORF Transcript_14125/g.30640 Transcript_14125/m.30640 type:complete len:91 (+) Transcript_14125:120-392(+)
MPTQPRVCLSKCHVHAWAAAADNIYEGCQPLMCHDQHFAARDSNATTCPYNPTYMTSHSLPQPTCSPEHPLAVKLMPTILRTRCATYSIS